ncbi:MAG: BamA/TamA family outer membrane protein [Bacteroidota bacterium]
MNKGQSLWLGIIILAIFVAGCGTTKAVPANDKLYTGARVTIEDSVLTAKQKKVLRTGLLALTTPKPNARFLGIAYKLNFYSLFYKSKPTSFFGKLRDKWGEPPVLLSQLDLDQNEIKLQNFLANKGFFKATVTGDTIASRRRARAEYKAIPGNQYTIASVQFPQDSSELSKNIAQSQAQSLLQVGKPFDLDLIIAERLRVDAWLKERGFYYFSPEYLLLKTDSTLGANKLAMYLTVKPETPEASAQRYYINDVFIYSNYSLNTARVDTNLANRQFYNGQYIVDRTEKYKPKLLDESMQFEPGDIYNRTEHNQTLTRLINLNLFKFVKNRFEIAGTDTPKLDVYYYLTPLPTRRISAEVTAISRSNNLNGSLVTFNWLNRNLFRNGSNFNFSAYVGSDVQFSGALAGYNTYRTGAQASISWPRFVGPFLNRSSAGPFAPRTNVNLGYDILNRKGLYTLNSYRAEYGYSYKKNLETERQFLPIAVTYVQPLDVTPAYDSLKRTFVGFDNAIQKQFILGGYYQHTYNGLASGQQKTNAHYVSSTIDVSGNIAGLITGANVKKGDTAKIAGTPFAQYVKLETDMRFYRRLGPLSMWVNRINVGFGLPYGNSTQLPYVKQFFVGGNNSLRGFRSRSVGPGTYFAGSGTVIPDQTGDIKLELNTELRPHISGPLYGALFVDAGNIWLFNNETYTQKQGAKFSSKFISQLAIDAGAGIRFDIQVFVLRLDVGVPIRKPWDNNYRINFGSRDWRRENIIYNLAIGYPF